MDQKREPSGQSPAPSPKRPKPPKKRHSEGGTSQSRSPQSDRTPTTVKDKAMGQGGSPLAAPPQGININASNIDPQLGGHSNPGSGSTAAPPLSTLPRLGMFTAMVGGASFAGGVIDDVNERTCVECKRVYKTVKAMHGHLWIHRNKFCRRMVRGGEPGPKLGEASGGNVRGEHGPEEEVEADENMEEGEIIEEEDEARSEEIQMDVGAAVQVEEQEVVRRGIGFDLNCSPPTDDDR